MRTELLSFSRRLASTALVAVFSLLVMTPAASAGDPPPVQRATDALDAEQAVAELVLLRKALERIHPGYDRYTSSEDRQPAWRSLEALAATGPRLEDWYREISRLLALLRCEHTRAELPTVLAEHKQQGAAFFPFRFRVFDEGLFIERAVADSGLSRGDQVVAFAGRPTSEVLAALRPFVPVDGWADDLRDASLEQDGDFLGNTFEQFYSLLFGDDPAVAMTILPAAGGERRTIEVKKIPFDEWLALDGPDAVRYLDFKDAVRHRRLDTKTAYLAVDTFVNYRQPVNAEKKLAPLFRRWNGDGVERLIVDLRNNGGGSDDAMIALLRLLADRPFELGAAAFTKTTAIGDDLKPYLSTWEQKALDPRAEWFEPADNGLFRLKPGVLGAKRRNLKPHPDRFRGEVLVLTSRFNGSGSTILLSLLKDRAFARLVGEKTGGNVSGLTAGILFFLNLPHSGIDVRVPLLLQTFDLQNPERFEADRGVQPDVLVEPTLDGMLSQRDEILEAAIALPARQGQEQPAASSPVSSPNDS
ncbi:MAG: S41 family peptidase [Acidobacteriota bacterium]